MITRLRRLMLSSLLERSYSVCYEEDEFSQLEVYVYEEKTGNLYVHHDIMLSAFPICLEWLAVEPSSFTNSEADRANLAVVGSFIPHIEIWDLDTLDVIEPKLVLQGVEQTPTISQKKKKAKKPSSEAGHSGAVISLSLNKIRK
jgi:periodic tryptophan protein 1